MNRAEAVRRLREYLPQYVEHSQQVHWIGPLPVANRALVLYGSTLSKADEIEGVDLANVVWSPYPGNLMSLYGAFGTLATRAIFDEYGMFILEDVLFKKSHPTCTSSSITVRVVREWPPMRIYREEEETAGAVEPWGVLWEPKMPDWEDVVEQIERREIPPTPDRSWFEVTTYLKLEIDREKELDWEKQQLTDWVFGVLEECEAGSARRSWHRLLVDIVLGWRHAPPFVREMLPWDDLRRGMELGLYEAVADEDWAFLLVCDMEEVMESDESYLRGES